MLHYSSFNVDVFSSIPEDAHYIMDVGCGTGTLGKALKSINSKRFVAGITYSNDEFEKASEILDEVMICDINKAVPIIERKFDCIVFSHVLEHTIYPAQILLQFGHALKENGIIIVALPNILYYKQRWQLITGKFRYSKFGGIMDETHYKFFDFFSAKQLLTENGFLVVKAYATGNFPLGKIRKFFPSFCKRVDSFFLGGFPGLFGFQFVLVGKKASS